MVRRSGAENMYRVLVVHGQCRLCMIAFCFDLTRKYRTPRPAGREQTVARAGAGGGSLGGQDEG